MFKYERRWLGHEMNKNARKNISDGVKLAYKNNPEILIKMCKSLKGRIPWNKGLKTSEETRKKQSEALKGKHRVYHEDGKYNYER